jgi:hypothetical protein
MTLSRPGTSSQRSFKQFTLEHIIVLPILETMAVLQLFRFQILVLV